MIRRIAVSSEPDSGAFASVRRSRKIVGPTSSRSARTVALLLFGVAAAAGCGPADAPAPPANAGEPSSSEGAAAQPGATRSANMSGETVYRAACAHCHDSGVSGAPVTGDPDRWSSPSPLWETVLAQHTSAGYLAASPDGEPELPGAGVRQATDYMIRRTFSQRPPD